MQYNEKRNTVGISKIFKSTMSTQRPEALAFLVLLYCGSLLEPRITCLVINKSERSTSSLRSLSKRSLDSWRENTTFCPQKSW